MLPWNAQPFVESSVTSSIAAAAGNPCCACSARTKPPCAEEVSTSLQDPMVIFTTKDKEEMFYRLIEHALNRTLVIVMQLADAEVVRSYGVDFWSAQRNIDPAKNVNVNTWLYVLWNEKLAFVKKSIDLSPFNSSYFLWMDVGFLRHGLYNGKRLAIHF